MQITMTPLHITSSEQELLDENVPGLPQRLKSAADAMGPKEDLGRLLGETHDRLNAQSDWAGSDGDHANEARTILNEIIDRHS